MCVFILFITAYVFSLYKINTLDYYVGDVCAVTNFMCVFIGPER